MVYLVSMPRRNGKTTLWRYWQFTMSNENLYALSTDELRWYMDFVDEAMK